jgi:hypothetical protein
VTGHDQAADRGRSAGSGDEISVYAADLVAAVEASLGPWIRRSVASRHPGPLTERIEARVEAAAAEAVADIGRRLRDLLALDIDDQWTNPLSIIRGAVAYPTAILRDEGVEPVDRDAAAHRLQPDDLYDLSPVTFGDLGPAAREPGLVWGAAKAHVHLSRRLAEPQGGGRAGSGRER